MPRNIMVRTCVVILVLFMGSVLLRGFTRVVLINNVPMNSPLKIFTEIVFFDNMELKLKEMKVNINWKKLYPFNTVSDTSNNITENKLSRLKERITDIEGAIEGYAKDYLVNRAMFVEWALHYEKAIGWNFLNGAVVDIGDGYLSGVPERYDTAASATALAELYGFLQESNIDFLYIQAPHKIASDDPISGVRDFSNQNADDLLYALSLRHIPYLDLRQNIKEEGLDHHALFYKTDHHWKAETGLWASGILLDCLNKNYGFGFDLDRVDPQEYHYTLYKDWFLGSLGKKVTLVRTKAEDFTLITPKFDTDFSLTVPELNLDTRGNFDILLDHPRLDIKDYYTLNPYGAYMYGDRQVVTAHNYLAPGTGKILLIRDSFASVVAPFLSAAVEDLHILDLRHFTGSVKSYIEKNKPDIVMILYNPTGVGDIQLFGFR